MLYAHPEVFIFHYSSDIVPYFTSSKTLFFQTITRVVR